MDDAVPSYNQDITNFEHIILEKAEVIVTQRIDDERVRNGFFVRGTTRIKRREAKRVKVGLSYSAGIDGRMSKSLRFLGVSVSITAYSQGLDRIE